MYIVQFIREMWEEISRGEKPYKISSYYVSVALHSYMILNDGGMGYKTHGIYGLRDATHSDTLAC